MEFQGRTAIVTGGASGIGKATASLLRELGATVVTWDYAEGADVTCDVSSLDSVRAALDQTLAMIEVPTVFVNCAGITSRALITDLDLDSWEKTIAVNARGTLITLGTIGNAMIDADVDQGSIVLVSSSASALPDPGMAAYGASKASVDYITRVAALEFGPHNIRVNSVSPGPTATPLTRRSQSSPEYRQLIIDTTPLGRIGTAEMLADAIVNTLRMEWVTGESIVADGGTRYVTPRGAARAKIGGNFSAGERSAPPNQASS